MLKHLFIIAALSGCTTDLGDEGLADQQNSETSDPWPTLDRIEREGPPRYTSRVHSCSKFRYLTLGNVLTSRGVNIASTTPLSAGAIYTSSLAALGGPNYAQRTRETIDVGLATESKIFDIFVQAAPEIIANLPSRAECQGAKLFDANNQCQLSGISCLIGVPATQTHVDLCNLTVQRADSVDQGKQLAVAVLAAAAHTCE